MVIWAGVYRLGWDSQLPVLTLDLKKDDKIVRLFSTITTLGTPLDLTTQELRIELFFPVDDQSKRFLGNGLIPEKSD